MTETNASGFTDAEAAAIAPYFTNLDRPVFALTNLPETVKGALFARYSRSPKSLRRLLLDEFMGTGLVSTGFPQEGTGLSGEGTGLPAGQVIRADKADKLYQRVFNDYGDDSVAQLGGVHLAVEDASNILTKVLERGRLMAYLEQSTRYIPYTDRRGDHWRYLVPAELDGHPLRAQFIATLNATFEIYAKWIPVDAGVVRGAVSEGADRLGWRVPRGHSREGARHAARAAAGGDAVERRHVRHRPGVRGAAAADARAPAGGSRARRADLMLTELRKVIPAFLTRVDQPDAAASLEPTTSRTRAREPRRSRRD